jgi:hypothetical protein
LVSERLVNRTYALQTIHYSYDALSRLTEAPELAVVVDSFEQKVQRPKASEERDDWYSHKKRSHPLKSQIAVDWAIKASATRIPWQPGAQETARQGQAPPARRHRLQPRLFPASYRGRKHHQLLVPLPSLVAD